MPNKHKPSTEEVFTNSTCRVLGHDWARTTADNYRRCQRNHCKATERLLNGVWVRALRERPWVDPRIGWARQAAQPQQTTLF
jgi:hypothetical protein